MVWAIRAQRAMMEINASPGRVRRLETRPLHPRDAGARLGDRGHAGDRPQSFDRRVMNLR